VVIRSAVGTLNNGKTEPGHLFLEVKKSILDTKTSQSAPGKVKISLETIQCTGYDDGGGNNAEEIIGKIFCRAYSVKDTISYRSQRLTPTANTAGALCNKDLETLLCITCPNWTLFGYYQLKTYTSSFTYDFPADGYIEVTGDLDEADSDDCRDLDYLGQPQKTYILTSELGTTPYRFTQFFASGKTIIKVNYMVQKVK
jgi:hypothetical protein